MLLVIAVVLDLMHHAQTIGRCGGQCADNDDSVSTMCCTSPGRLGHIFSSAQVRINKTVSPALGQFELNTIKKMHHPLDTIGKEETGEFGVFL